MELSELRKEIDAIDDQLLPLLQRRMAISREVAAYKHAHGMAVLNEQREQEILDEVGRKSGADAALMRTVFSAVMDASRALQHQIMGGGDTLRKTVDSALGKTMCTDGAHVACFGDFGSNAHAACRRVFAENCPVQFYKSFEEIFRAVQSGTAGYGIVPVENSTAGSVHESYDLIMKYKFFIVRAIDVPISYCIGVRNGTSPENVTKVYSHHQALRQCDGYIRRHDLVPIHFSNTAGAAKFVAESSAQDTAAICTVAAAKQYGLQIVENEIEDVRGNTTRFIVFAKELAIPQNADKISLIFRQPNRTGSLYHVLGRFAMAGLNMTKLESRPLQDSAFNYNFYADLEGSVRDARTLDLLCALSDELPEFTFLGNFVESD